MSNSFNENNLNKLNRNLVKTSDNSWSIEDTEVTFKNVDGKLEAYNEGGLMAANVTDISVLADTLANNVKPEFTKLKEYASELNIHKNPTKE